ncbi:MAG: hypothetical protein ABIC19_00160 [Patescibacteria group bacterium]|nr:hypothetical protein [Patescibacteria group bacterium]
MNYEHQELAKGRWKSLSFFEQMGNVGSEVERTINWKKKKNFQYSQKSLERALELLDLTIEANKNNFSRLRELLRTREVLLDYFVGENQYASTDKKWQNYFYAFMWAARVAK